MQKFNAQEIYSSFELLLKVVAENERITKDSLRSMSRELLMLIHYEHNRKGDIQPVNRLLKVLSPANKKMCILFFQEFSGFLFSEKEGEFIKKDKAQYDAKASDAIHRLDDPHFNAWSWFEANVKMEKKAFKLETLGKDVKKAMEAKDEEGNNLYSKVDIVQAVLSGGMSIDDLIDVLQAMDVVEVN